MLTERMHPDDARSEDGIAVVLMDDIQMGWRKD